MIKFYINFIFLLSIFSFHPFVKDLYCFKFPLQIIPEDTVEKLKDDEFSNKTIDALLTLNNTEFRQVAGYGYINLFDDLYRRFKKKEKKDLIVTLPTKEPERDPASNVEFQWFAETDNVCKIKGKNILDDENLQILFQIKVKLNRIETSMYDSGMNNYSYIVKKAKEDSNLNYLNYLKAVIKFAGYYTKDVLLPIVDGTLKKEDAKGLQAALFDILGTPEDANDKETIYGRMKKIMGKSRFSLEDLKTMINDHKFLFASGYHFLPIYDKFYITVLKDKSVFDYVPTELK